MSNQRVVRSRLVLGLLSSSGHYKDVSLSAISLNSLRPHSDCPKTEEFHEVISISIEHIVRIVESARPMFYIILIYGYDNLNQAIKCTLYYLVGEVPQWL